MPITLPPPTQSVGLQQLPHSACPNQVKSGTKNWASVRKTMDGWGEDGAGVRVGGGLERDSDIETERESF